MTTMSEFLTKEQLLAACERKYHVVDVKDVGAVRVQTLNDLEHSDISASLINKEGKVSGELMPHLRRLVASKMIVDESGKRMFASAEEAGTTLLPEIVKAVYAKYLELNDGGLAKEVKKQKKD